MIVVQISKRRPDITSQAMFLDVHTKVIGRFKAFIHFIASNQ